jgi:hypothetical protein
MEICAPYYHKHPSDILDLVPDWSRWLDGDVITASAWDTGGLAQVAASFTGSTTTLRFSGGVSGTRYELKNTITTAGGRQEVRRFRVMVEAASAAPDATRFWQDRTVT